MTSKVTVNPAKIAVFVRTPGPDKAIDDTAKKLQRAAEENTPDHTGYARRRYRVVKRPGGRRLINTDWFFHLIEWGSVNNPVYAPMRKAARALGLKFKESDR